MDNNHHQKNHQNDTNLQKMNNYTLTGVAQLIGMLSYIPKGVGLIPD